MFDIIFRVDYTFDTKQSITPIRMINPFYYESFKFHGDVIDGNDFRITDSSWGESTSDRVGVHEGNPPVTELESPPMLCCPVPESELRLSKWPPTLKSHEILFAHNLFISYLIALKFCTEHGSDTAVLCAKFQNDWTVVVDERDFARFEFKTSFGRISYILHSIPGSGPHISICLFNWSMLVIHTDTH